MSTDEGKITAPWTEEQVAQLWQRQASGHPYTCPTHTAFPLSPQPDGWHCFAPHCGYYQDWAHASDLEPVLTGNQYAIWKAALKKARKYAWHLPECEWQKRGEPTDPKFVGWVKGWAAAGSPCSCGFKELFGE